MGETYADGLNSISFHPAFVCVCVYVYVWLRYSVTRSCLTLRPLGSSVMKFFRCALAAQLELLNREQDELHSSADRLSLWCLHWKNLGKPVGKTAWQTLPGKFQPLYLWVWVIHRGKEWKASQRRMGRWIEEVYVTSGAGQGRRRKDNPLSYFGVAHGRTMGSFQHPTGHWTRYLIRSLRYKEFQLCIVRIHFHGILPWFVHFEGEVYVWPLDSHLLLTWAHSHQEMAVKAVVQLLPQNEQNHAVKTAMEMQMWTIHNWNSFAMEGPDEYLVQ